MDDEQSRLADAVALLILAQLENALVTQNDCAHADCVAISETKSDVLSFDLLHRDRRQLEHVELSQVQLLLVDLLIRECTAATFLAHLILISRCEVL